MYWGFLVLVGSLSIPFHFPLSLEVYALLVSGQGGYELINPEYHALARKFALIYGAKWPKRSLPGTRYVFPPSCPYRPLSNQKEATESSPWPFYALEGLGKWNANDCCHVASVRIATLDKFFSFSYVSFQRVRDSGQRSVLSELLFSCSAGLSATLSSAFQRQSLRSFPHKVSIPYRATMVSRIAPAIG